MRNLNIKKLVAVAAGAVLVGSALAPIVSAISLTKSDLVSGTGVNVDVIVGKKASVSDGVWAGNIAVAIGQQAYSEKEVLVGDADCSGGATPSVTGLSVDLTVGGTTTVTGGKTFYDDMYSGNNGGQEQNFNSKFVTNDSVPSLYYNGSKSYTWNGTGYTTSIQERLYFTVDVKFDDTVNNALVAEITQGNLKYNLNLGSGIPRYEGLSGTDNFTDDGNDNVRIPFFGTDYLVKNVTTTYVELLQTSGETQYSEGDRITDLEGYDGGMYYLEIGRGGIVSSAEKIILSLYKEDGTLVKTASFGTGDVVFYGDYGDYAGEPVISTLVNISEILKTVQSDAEVYTPTIFVGSARILLYNEKGYPYDTTLPEDDYDWKVNLNFDGNYLKDINIQNKTKYDFVALDALKIGEKANFPGELGTIEFLGLQLPEFTGVSKNERTTVIEIKDGKMLYKDSTYEAAHEVPMYYYSGLTISDEGTDTVTIDSKVQWFKLSLDDINVLSNTSADGSGTDYGCIGDGNYINGEKVFVNDVNQQGGIKQVAINNIGVTSAAADYNVGERVDINGMNFLVSGLSNDSNCVYLTADGNATFRKDVSSGTLVQRIYYVDQNYTNNAPLTFEGASGITYDYEWMIDEAAGNTIAKLWLFYDAQAKVGQYNKYIQLVGTDTQERTKPYGTVGVHYYPFYLPHLQALPLLMEGDSNFNSNEYFTAQFRIDDATENGTYDINVFVDSGTGNLIVTPNTQLTLPTVEVDYNGGLRYVDENPTSIYPSTAYTDFGSKIELNNHNFKITIPEGRPQAEVLVSGTGTSTTVAGGEDLTIAEGETGSTTGGTRVTVTNVTYNATCGGGTGTGTGTCTATPTTYMKQISVSNLVKYDDSTSSATHIIVGGWKVNKLAEGVTLADGSNLKSRLTKTGDYVVEKTPSGDIIVAGYNSGATGTAAQELINAIDNL